MKKIELTQDQVALIDDEDFDKVNQFKWHMNKIGRNTYAARNIKKPNGSWRTLFLHQFLIPEAEYVDHRDGNGLNCQRSNMRRASNQQNTQAFCRKAKGTTSQFRGVSWCNRNKNWRATIYINKKLIHLGYFLFEQDAARAYDDTARKSFGEFASPNFPI